MENSLEDKPEVKMFLAFLSSCTFLFSSSFISSHSLGTNSPFNSLVGINGPLTIAFHTPVGSSGLRIIKKGVELIIDEPLLIKIYPF